MADHSLPINVYVTYTRASELPGTIDILDQITVVLEAVLCTVMMPGALHLAERLQSNTSPEPQTLPSVPPGGRFIPVENHCFGCGNRLP